MRSFTKRLVLNCTGMIFVCLLIVYFLFNSMMGNYIRDEAERELSASLSDFVEMAYGLAAAGQFLDEGGFLPLEHIYTIRPIRRSIIATDVIMINEHNEIIMPWVFLLDDAQRSSIEFLANYYVFNQTRFANEEMVMVTNAASTYYMSTLNYVINDSPISMLIYTDISSPIAFKDSMNNRLGLLLVVSGVLSLGITIMMSAQFKKAIKRLCRRAETIGHGNFNEAVGVFEHTEFNDLSKSMDNMSNMLQAYENNQKQFFQNVSHELRTPLMSIRGYAEGIRENIVDKDTAVDIILSWESRMTGLVNGLLYISRIDEGLESPKNIASVDVKNLLFSCYERVKPIAAKAQKEITINAPDSDITLNTDEEKLERAIINILSNAIRYAKSSVLISYKAIEGSLEISIQDDGEGIAPKDLPRIFERFYKGNKGNSGLGLAISKDIINSLNGKIRAENISSPNTGAVFTVVLPRNS